MWTNVGYGQFLTPGEPTIECEIAKDADEVAHLGFWAADEWVLVRATQALVTPVRYVLADYPADKEGWKRLPKFTSNDTCETLAKQGWNPLRSVILGADDERRTQALAEPPDVSAWVPPTDEPADTVRAAINQSAAPGALAYAPGSAGTPPTVYSLYDELQGIKSMLTSILAKLEGAGQ
jgi:hypothetical protein